MIIGEGTADSEFLKALIAERSLTGLQVARAAQDKTHFGRRLEAIKLVEGFGQVETIVLVRDSNGDADAAFRETVAQIRKDTTDYASPAAPLKPSAKGAKAPRIVVLLIPWSDREGALESLLLEAIEPHHEEIAKRMADTLAVSPTRDCNVSKRAKSRMSCIVAAVCIEDPSCAVSWLWKEEKGMRHYLASGKLDQVVAYLRAWGENPSSGPT